MHSRLCTSSVGSATLSPADTKLARLRAAMTAGSAADSEQACEVSSREVALDRDAVVASIGPTIQRYMTIHI